MPRRLCLAKTLVGDSFDQNHLCNNVTRPGPYLVDLKVDWAFGEQQPNALSTGIGVLMEGP